jgi:cell division protein FtsB
MDNLGDLMAMAIFVGILSAGIAFPPYLWLRARRQPRAGDAARRELAALRARVERLEATINDIAVDVARNARDQRYLLAWMTERGQEAPRPLRDATSVTPR